MMNTVFTVREGENPSFQIEGTGQETINAIRKSYPGKSIILNGFMGSDGFVPVNLKTQNRYSTNPNLIHKI